MPDDLRGEAEDVERIAANIIKDRSNAYFLAIIGAVELRVAYHAGATIDPVAHRERGEGMEILITAMIHRYALDSLGNANKVDPHRDFSRQVLNRLLVHAMGETR